MAQTKRILLLDDDYESMSPLKFFLEAVHGHSVELSAAANITDRLRTERFDLLCVDLMIHPISLDADNQEVTNLHFEGVNWQKTGLTFLQKLRQGAFDHKEGLGTSSQVPVLILSAVANHLLDEQLMTADQCTAYLEKPFDLEELMSTLEQLLNQPVAKEA